MLHDGSPLHRLLEDSSMKSYAEEKTHLNSTNNTHGLVRIDTPETIYFLNASETLSLLEWLYQRRDTIYHMSQHEQGEEPLLPGQQRGLGPDSADKFNWPASSFRWDDPKVQAEWDKLGDDE
jgi:hypothetical protein